MVLVCVWGQKKQMKVLGKLVILIFSAGAILATAQAGILPGPVIPEGLGVNIHFMDPKPGELDMLAGAGIRWVRTVLSWKATEPEKGKYDFSSYDRLLAALGSHQLKAVLILDGDNPLYGFESLASDAGRQAYSRWAVAAVEHFKGRGILWEILNEPNGDFWKRYINADQYASLAVAASKAIREVAPNEAIMGPATSGMDFKFLEACFRGHVLDWWDAVSVHPYRQSGPETVERDYQTLRSLIARYAPKGRFVEVVSGEWGYSSKWRRIDPDTQGKMLTRQWLVNLANNIPLSIWYDWHDDGPAANNPQHHFGMVEFAYRLGNRQVFGAKPAYLAAKALTTVLNGYIFTERFPTGNDRDYVLVFNKENEARAVVWTTAPHSHPITLPGFHGTIQAVSYNGQMLGQLVTTGNAVTLELTDSPVFLIPKNGWISLPRSTIGR